MRPWGLLIDSLVARNLWRHLCVKTFHNYTGVKSTFSCWHWFKEEHVFEKFSTVYLISGTFCFWQSSCGINSHPNNRQSRMLLFNQTSSLFSWSFYACCEIKGRKFQGMWLWFLVYQKAKFGVKYLWYYFCFTSSL